MEILFVQIIRGLSGSEKYIIETLAQMKERGVTGELLCVHMLEDGDKYRLVTDPIEAQKGKVHFVSTEKEISFKLLKDINKVLKQKEYDLVVTNLIHADLWLALVKCFFNRKVKIVSIKHGYDNVFTQAYGHNPSKRMYNLYFFLAWFAERFVRHSITVSDGLKNLYTSLKISNKEKISTIHLGFDLEYKQTLLESECRKGSLQICIVGRLIKLKGHEYAFRAFKKVLEKFEEVELVLVGDGDERANLEALCRELGIENNVHFMGFNKHPMDFMHYSDLVMVPSKSEGFGIVVIEAFAVKTPVIAFDVPACNELIVNNESGYLVKPFDTDELAAKMIDLLENPTKAQAFAEKGYERLNTEFTPGKMIDKTVLQLEQIASKTS